MKYTFFFILTIVCVFIVQAPGISQAEKKCSDGLTITNMSPTNVSCNVYWKNDNRSFPLHPGDRHTYKASEKTVIKVICYYLPVLYAEGSISINPQYCNYEVRENSGASPPIQLTPIQ